MDDLNQILGNKKKSEPRKFYSAPRDFERRVDLRLAKKRRLSLAYHFLGDIYYDPAFDGNEIISLYFTPHYQITIIGKCLPELYMALQEQRVQWMRCAEEADISHAGEVYIEEIRTLKLYDPLVVHRVLREQAKRAGLDSSKP